MKCTRREKQIYTKLKITFACNIFFINFIVAGCIYEFYLLCVVGYIGIIGSLLYMFWLGHCLGWEQKRISMIEKEE